MRQPGCDEEGYGECVQQPEALPSRPVFSWDDAKPAVLMLAALLLSYGVFYWWAQRHGKYRISDLSKKGSKAFRWIGVTIIAGMVLFTWHLVFGGPL